MKEGLFEFSVWVDGRPVPEHLDGVGGITWIQGVREQEFALHVQNATNNRVLAVVSVDGLSVMDGKPANYSSGGYILSGGSHILIPGWRLDNNSVARFEFGVSAEGYATLMNQSPRNIGVIACAFFAEAPTVTDIDSGDMLASRRIDSPASREMGSLASRVTDLLASHDSSGTSKSSTRPGVETTTDNIAVKFGEKATHKVVVGSFERASDKPEALLSVRYDTVDGLRARGIGCEPPKGWKGRFSRR
ncbi:MAG: hypothetical protein KBE65_20740 [Phycisphaerae bacterium]|nr:hypothetical protein [Phycisphaerae bacterium]